MLVMKGNLNNQEHMRMTKSSTSRTLSSLNIKPTSQRVDIANIIFCKDQHLSAENIIAICDVQKMSV